MRFLGEAHDLALRVGLQNAKARDRRDGGDGRDLAVLFVKVDETGNVDVAEAVAVGQEECVVIGYIARDALQAAARHGFEAGVGERDGEILLLMGAHEFDV